ncbi:MAG: FIST C-terminal domain-containing protein [Raoultibacter sp.]
MCCDYEYIDNGTVASLGESLPFDFIGSTTTIPSVCGEAGEDVLGLLVLTSDDVYFATGITESLEEDYEQKIDSIYNSTCAKLPGNPTLGIFAGPFMLSLSSDTQTAALNKASNGLPLFGGISLDYDEHVENPSTLHNGQAYSSALPLILFSGNLQPSFFLESIPESRFVKQKAVITKSERNILQEVNNIPAMDYIESLGLAKDGIIDSIPSIPLSIDIGDGGSPVARAILGMTPQGEVVCGGEMPESAALGVGSFNPDDVRFTVERLSQNIISTPNPQGALIVSCFSRNLALGLDTLAEIEKVQEVLGDEVPYLLFYSSGEIFPEITESKVYNKAHNDSIIACVF